MHHRHKVRRATKESTHGNIPPAWIRGQPGTGSDATSAVTTSAASAESDDVGGPQPRAMTSAVPQVSVTTVVTTSVTDGVRGVEEKPKLQGGSTGANSPSPKQSKRPDAAVTRCMSVAP